MTIIKSNFISDSLLLIMANGLVGAVYMLIHIILGRRLGEIDYAELVALLSLLNVISLPSGVIQVVMARYVAQYAAEDAATHWVTIVKRASRKITTWGFLAFILWIFASFILKDLLRAPSFMSLIVLGAIALAGFYAPLLQGVLQGQRFFNWMVLSNIGSALGRLAFCILVVFYGGSVTAVLTAIYFSAILGLAIAWQPIRHVIRSTESFVQFDTKPIYKYAWVVALGQVAMYVLVNLDLILSSRFFSGDELAAYGKAAMLSRIALFLPQPIAVAMFPRAVVSHQLKLVVWAFSSMFVLTVLPAMAIYCFPNFFLDVMYGLRGGLYMTFVKYYVWAVVPLAMMNIIIQYLWARNKMSAVLSLLPAALIYTLLLYYYHHSFRQVMLCMMAGGWLAFIFLGVALFALYRTNRNTM